MKKYLSTSNSKLKKDKIASWGIPAYKDANGELTCPMAGQCAKAEGCYALQGTYKWSNVAKAYQDRYELSKSDNFINTIDSEIKASKSIKIIRLHDSGDFYNKKYLNDWLDIINKNPGIQFYTYTKMVSMFKGLDLPGNFTVIYSYGGKQDHLIDPNVDRHSKVFSSHEEMMSAGYVDTTERDINAIGPNHRIGLVYHGAKSKAWNTKEVA